MGLALSRFILIQYYCKDVQTLKVVTGCDNLFFRWWSKQPDAHKYRFFHQTAADEGIEQTFSRFSPHSLQHLYIEILCMAIYRCLLILAGYSPEVNTRYLWKGEK